MSKLYWPKRAYVVLILFATTAIALPAQDEQPSSNSVKFTNLANFDGSNGNYPIGGLLQGTDGNLYGTTLFGGANGAFDGTVFKVTPTGTLTALYSFCAQTNCADGSNPYDYGGLALGVDGNFYGTTQQGGANGHGTIFKITPRGVLTTLYNFCSEQNCVDGDIDYTGLIQGADGNFYGTTPYGGSNQSSGCGDGVGVGCGNVFKITPAGTLTTIYSFCAQTNCADGNSPNTELIQGTDGNFYGLTPLGGAYGYGTIFRITLDGTLTNFAQLRWYRR